MKKGQKNHQMTTPFNFCQTVSKKSKWQPWETYATGSFPDNELATQNRWNQLPKDNIVRTCKTYFKNSNISPHSKSCKHVAVTEMVTL